ncbi:hypothetical protein NEIELOOT_00721 [Neisseria elongata subsp. glycolytica ATCC 29315]|uniref:Uncharacterized protein n=1 Tax=Neisseria elongata subsp. glycolytica ATCC 29315 TaxID=546263 RepID=D4DNT7_NEIEG|nr:hypothetical protein NEIELOOT_00721 [Neisseria elongata subsp. glycolytica ATCC 29315]
MCRLLLSSEKQPAHQSFSKIPVRTDIFRRPSRQNTVVSIHERKPTQSA